MKTDLPLQLKLSAIFFLWLLLSGCAVSPPHLSPVAHSPKDCGEFLKILDDTIHQHGVETAAVSRLSGFPYLRTNRFLSALGLRLADENQVNDWLDLMKQSAIKSIDKEIMNLPDAAVEHLSGKALISSGRAGLIRKAVECYERCLTNDRVIKDFKASVVAASIVPQEYSLALRVAGLYPIAALPVTYLTHKGQKKFSQWLKTPPEQLRVYGRLMIFGPGVAKDMNFDIKKLFQTTPRNALNMPIFNDETIRKIAVTLAPTFVQDVAGAYDIPGKVIRRAGRVGMDTGTPALYYYLSYALLKDTPVVQINYSIWYTKREGPEAPWIERGPLDGITIRITLDDTGIPLVLDIMNSCGCYHMFIPKKSAVLGIREKPFAIDAFLPQFLPESFPDTPLTLRINSGWHQVQNIASLTDPVIPGTPYALIPYDELESLPDERGNYDSVFDRKGIMKDSKRIEPFLLFSMGIPSVGSMRQRGNHAVSLVGRDHFDDPYFFDNSLRFK